MSLKILHYSNFQSIITNIPKIIKQAKQNKNTRARHITWQGKILNATNMLLHKLCLLELQTKRISKRYQEYLKKLNLSLTSGYSLISKISISLILDLPYISRTSELIMKKSLQMKTPINLRHVLLPYVNLNH